MSVNDNKEVVKYYIDHISFYRKLKSDLKKIAKPDNKIKSDKILDDLEDQVTSLLFLENEINTGNKNVTVAIIGDFNSGKSSFINSLLRENICPVRANPTTSSITTFIYSDQKKILCNTVEEPISPDKYKELVTHKFEHSEIAKNYTFEYHYPFKDLKNIQILDTPGFNNPDNQDDTNLTTEKAKSADILFYIIDIENAAMLASEVERIKNLQKILSKNHWYLVVNKYDSKLPKKQSIINYIKSKHKELFSEIYLYSSKYNCKEEFKDKTTADLVWDYLNTNLKNQNDEKLNFSIMKTDDCISIDDESISEDDPINAITSFINREKIINLLKEKSETKQKTLKTILNDKKSNYRKAAKSSLDEIEQLIITNKTEYNFNQEKDYFLKKIENEITKFNYGEFSYHLLSDSFEIAEVPKNEKNYLFSPYYKIHKNMWVEHNISDRVNSKFDKFAGLNGRISELSNKIQNAERKVHKDLEHATKQFKDNFSEIIKEKLTEFYNNYFENRYKNSKKTASLYKKGIIKKEIPKITQDLTSIKTDYLKKIEDILTELRGEIKASKNYFGNEKKKIIDEIRDFKTNLEKKWNN